MNFTYTSFLKTSKALVIKMISKLTTLIKESLLIIRDYKVRSKAGHNKEMLVQEVLPAMVRDTMCATHTTEKETGYPVGKWRLD